MTRISWAKVFETCEDAVLPYEKVVEWYNSIKFRYPLLCKFAKHTFEDNVR